MKNTERWFRVRFGYGKTEFISIPLDKLATAIYAKQTGGSFMYGANLIDGREIKTITPDVHVHTGWNPLYEVKDAEDMRQIERDCPKDYNDLMNRATSLAIRASVEGDMLLLNEPVLLLTA